VLGDRARPAIQELKLEGGLGTRLAGEDTGGGHEECHQGNESVAEGLHAARSKVLSSREPKKSTMLGKRASRSTWNSPSATAWPVATPQV